jgi:putative glutathione S-transferase
MGRMVDGVWHGDEGYAQERHGGRFVREDSGFRAWITPDGSSGFPAEAGRYHLYVSLACPWAHRTLIARRLKGLEDAISVSVVHWLMDEDGWSFREGPGCTPDTVHGARHLHEIYRKAKPDYTGRVTVPVLWDKERGTIVNNESADILRMLGGPTFDALGDPELDLYPEPLRPEIDAVNALVYPKVNNGVYRCGFATTQEAYEEAFRDLFAALGELEGRLGRSRYLVGGRRTEADWRLFTTLLRFDPVYHGHFKCNLRRIRDYANLSGFLRELYQVSGVAETCDLHHIKHHYYESHRGINPTGVVPLGPEMDLDAPHGRG